MIGEITLQEMVKDFSAEQRKKIIQKQVCESEKTAKFKFGDGKTIAAQKIVHIPVQTSERTVKLKTFVKPGQIPFLLGIQTLTKMNAVIDLKMRSVMRRKTSHFVVKN